VGKKREEKREQGDSGLQNIAFLYDRIALILIKARKENLLWQEILCYSFIED